MCRANHQNERNATMKTSFAFEIRASATEADLNKKAKALCDQISGFANNPMNWAYTDSDKSKYTEKNIFVDVSYDAPDYGWRVPRGKIIDEIQKWCKDLCGVMRECPNKNEEMGSEYAISRVIVEISDLNNDAGGLKVEVREDDDCDAYDVWQGFFIIPEKSTK